MKGKDDEPNRGEVFFEKKNRDDVAACYLPVPPAKGVLQCVAVCCSVLLCVAVCCSVLQCVAVC